MNLSFQKIKKDFLPIIINFECWFGDAWLIPIRYSISDFMSCAFYDEVNDITQLILIILPIMLESIINIVSYLLINNQYSKLL